MLYLTGSGAQADRLRRRYAAHGVRLELLASRRREVVYPACGLLPELEAQQLAVHVVVAVDGQIDVAGVCLTGKGVVSQTYQFTLAEHSHLIQLVAVVVACAVLVLDKDLSAHRHRIRVQIPVNHAVFPRAACLDDVFDIHRFA